MPSYTYRDRRTGELVVRNVPVAQRDALPDLERIFEPGMPCPRLGQKRPSLQARQVLRGYEQLESRGELRGVSRARADHIKRVWAEAKDGE